MGGKPNPGTKRDMRLKENKRPAKANTSARKSATQSSLGRKGGK